ncbi:MAG: hypothetical protein ACMUHY_06770 [Thermoplasmatota archaeon]
MTKRSCTDLALVCPDIKCPRCNKPYQTWVWKENLLFTCPECSEIGFSVENITLNERALPKESFFSNMDMPCPEDPDPSCTIRTKMLFIDNYESLDYLEEHFKNSGSFENYSQMQRSIGIAYEMIISRIRG